MRSLIDFFNHGVLPFTGRRAEAEQITEFWRGTAEAHGLRAMLVTGEAGAGKSRLVEEVAPAITAAGGLVIAAKLYPGATTALAPLLAQALWFSRTGRQLLKKEPEGTIPAVTMALARLARLRPTLLVLEDIHLLGGEALGEFSSLLAGLADETVSLLCAARPVELKARGVLERYLVAELELNPLDETVLADLWQHLFRMEPESDVVHALYRATLGNPLALRSALRGVLKSQAIEHDPKSESWRLTVSGDTLAQILERNIRYLSEGMAAYLSEEERLAAEQLACLGEVFAREGGRVILDDADRMLDVLTFRGIIAPSVTATALAGRTSDHPLLAFTHTLLHHYLAERAEPNVGRIITLLGEGIPLYSVLPFRIITQHAGMPGATLEQMCRAIDRSLMVAYALDRTPDWEMAREVMRTAEMLAGYCREHHSAEKQRELEIRLIDCRLALMRRDEHTEEFTTQLERLLELTEPPLPASYQHHRISALRHLFKSLRRRDIDRCLRIWDEIDALIIETPELQWHCSYIQFLQIASLVTMADSDSEMIPRAERSLEAALALPQVSDDLRVYAMREVMPLFLGQFSSHDQLDRRRKLLAEIEPYIDEDDMTFRTRKLAFLEGLGEVFEALKVIDDTIPRLKARGLLNHVAQTSLIRLSAIGLLTTEVTELEAQARQLCADAPEAILHQVRLRAGSRLAQIGLLRGENLWARHVVDIFIGDARQLPPKDQTMLAVAEGRLQETVEYLLEQDLVEYPVDKLMLMLLDADATMSDEEVAALQHFLRDQVVTRSDIQNIHIIAATIEALGSSEEACRVRAVVKSALHYAFVHGLEWLAEHSLPGAMQPLVSHYDWVLDEGERAAWRKRIAAIEEQLPGLSPKNSGNRQLRISMLGTIGTHFPDGTMNPMRGARLRTLLGLLVLDQMVEKPFSYREFCRLAASGEENPDKARKVMNMGVLRLREAIGPDAILTDTESPRLNIDYARVDLLEAHRLLGEAVDAAREGAMMRAVGAMIEALDSAAGQVPFPGLYEDVFEAAREDFENRLRSGIIEVSSSVLREGDAISAEAILRRGFEAMPDDEELADLLRQTLVRLGKRVEAERVRMRVEEELE
jgi:hypothetical protein